VFTLEVMNTSDAPMAKVALIGQQLIENQPFNFSIDANRFNNIGTGDLLNYSALNSDGSPLPAWLNFDNKTLIFSGIADGGVQDPQVVLVTATDSNGLSASNSFNLSVISGENNIPDSDLDEWITDAVISSSPAGSDRLYSVDGYEELTGGDGDYLIVSQNGDELSFADLGDDNRYAEIDNTSPVSNASLEPLYASQGNDLFYGDHDSDYLNGGAEIDLINAGDGSDAVMSAGDIDLLRNGIVDGRIYDVTGIDEFKESFENGRLSGNDRLTGFTGNDDPTGRAVDGSDWLGQGTGRDVLIGYQADDQAIDTAIFQDMNMDADSSGLLNNQVDQLVSAMVSFNVPTDDGRIIASDENYEHSAVLVQTWQAA